MKDFSLNSRGRCVADVRRCWTILGLTFTCSVLSVRAADPAASEFGLTSWSASTISREVADTASRRSQIDCFRREFPLGSDCASAVLRLSADFLYKIYVNGRFVGDGPPRTSVGAPAYYVSYELRPFLQVGANALAIEVFALGPQNPFNGGDVQTAIKRYYGLGEKGKQQAPSLSGILELRDPAKRSIAMLTTDRTWRVRPSAWQEITAEISAGFSLPEVFDAKNEPEGWKQPGFDDSKWEVAGESPTSDRLPSPLPHYQRVHRLPVAVNFVGEITQLNRAGADPKMPAGVQMATETPRPSRFTQIDNATGLLAENRGPAIVNNNVNTRDQFSYYQFLEKQKEVPLLREATMILDYGEIQNAFVALEIEGPAGASIDIGWGQNLVDEKVPTWHTWPRAGSFVQHQATRYYLKNGRQRWETFHWQNFRYLQLTFRGASAPIKVYQVTAEQSGVPLTPTGSFSCSDPLLGKLFDATEKTLRAATYDFFMDNGIREKLAWGGDVAEASVLGCLPVFGDVPTVRYYLDQFRRSQELIGTGQIPANGTSNLAGNHFLHGLRTAIVMAEYGLWCGDTKYYATKFLPALKRYRNYLKGRVNQEGLLTVREGESTWVDHIRGVNAVDVSATANILYIILLQKSAAVLKAFDDSGQAQEVMAAENVLKKTVRERFWDPKRGLFFDGSAKGIPSATLTQHANYLALYAGLVDKGDEAGFLARVADAKYDNKIVRFGPPFLHWPQAALFMVGRGQEGVDLMRDRYSLFLRDGGTTFWEGWSWGLLGNTWEPSYLSLAQNGAGAPAWFLHTEILGVKPTAAGFAEFEIAPSLCGLEWAKGVVPSPRGDIVVSWERKGNVFTIAVTVPPNTRATLRMPGEDKTVHLGPGDHRVEGAGGL